MVIGIYPGTFDPPTIGHMDIIRRSKSFCDKLIIAIGKNPTKTNSFPIEFRMRMIEKSMVESGIIKNDRFGDFTISSFDGLLINYASKVGANIIVRGIRSVSDFEYEINLANVNKILQPSIESIFLPTSPELAVVSSSMVKEISKHGGDVSKFVSGDTLKFLNGLNFKK